MKTKTTHGLIIILNMGVFLLASNFNNSMLYYPAVIVPLATIAFFFYIKLFAQKSDLFRGISIKQGLLFIAVMVLFVVAGMIRTNNILNSITQ